MGLWLPEVLRPVYAGEQAERIPSSIKAGSQINLCWSRMSYMSSCLHAQDCMSTLASPSLAPGQDAPARSAYQPSLIVIHSADRHTQNNMPCDFPVVVNVSACPAPISVNRSCLAFQHMKTPLCSASTWLS
jgi:hypothetical protein